MLSTARGHGNRRVRPGATRRALARAYPHRRRIAPGIFQAAPGSNRVLGVARGRVRFVGVASDRVLRGPRRLARDLRAARR